MYLTPPADPSNAIHPPTYSTTVLRPSQTYYCFYHTIFRESLFQTKYQKRSKLKKLMKTGGSLPVLKLTFKADGIWPLWYASGPGVKLICGECRREVFAPSCKPPFGILLVKTCCKEHHHGDPKGEPWSYQFLEREKSKVQRVDIILGNCQVPPRGIFKEEYLSKSSSESNPLQHKKGKGRNQMLSPSVQMMAAIPIVLNLESRGLSGFMIALYLGFHQI